MCWLWKSEGNCIDFNWIVDHIPEVMEVTIFNVSRSECDLHNELRTTLYFFPRKERWFPETLRDLTDGGDGYRKTLKIISRVGDQVPVTSVYDISHQETL